jgi:aminopeptidase N
MARKLAFVSANAVLRHTASLSLRRSALPQRVFPSTFAPRVWHPDPRLSPQAPARYSLVPASLRHFASPSGRNHNARAPATMTSVASEPAAPPQTIRIEDYTRPPFLIDNVFLTFELDDKGLATVVRARLDVRRAPETPADQDLVLDGEHVSLVANSLAIDGKPLGTSGFSSTDTTLKISAEALPKGSNPFTFESAVTIQPAKNKALEGLYMSTGTYCTQCEAEGFRRITYFLDRPDVMSKYTVRIEANKTLFPVLLSNGNMVEEGLVPGSAEKHFVVYEDPWAKPAYLFALVAGELSHLEDHFTTCGGKDVRLRIYVKGKDEVSKCSHAMASLKKALKWEEDVYGLEYDLSIFNIVAVPDFSMGAMENKSLNIFNSKYILVSGETATDGDFNGVEGVVAHELFHNYSGNRVTLCRWFELTLKEGLTVFRDQSFSADMNSAAVKRIRDVTGLRASQFAEDAGPLAHPIRPTSYITPSTFYTSTVYSKGAEVIRMLHTFVGVEGFRRGTDLYFSKHDGQAVTCEDFLNCIQEKNPDVDLSTFPRWYAQSGTPVVTVGVSHDVSSQTMTLSFSQVVPTSSKQSNPLPALIPIRMGLVGPDGRAVHVDDGQGPAAETKVLVLRDAKQTFVLKNVPTGTVPSLFRGFSAPVKVVRAGGLNRDELAFLMANDTDTFNSWESGQIIALDVLLEYIRHDGDVSTFAKLPDVVVSAFKKALANEAVDPALRAELFSLPLESYIIEQLDVADPVRVRAARRFVRTQLAAALKDEMNAVLKECQDSGKYKLDQASQGKRALKNVALSYLATLEDKSTNARLLEQVRSGSNMTDVLAALSILANGKSEEREVALAEFYKTWEHDQLVVQKWLRTQSTSMAEGVLETVRHLLNHKAFDINNPNDVYSLLGGFAYANLHHVGLEGYEFLADQIIRLDRINPQVAARVARAFNRWRKFDQSRQTAMETQFKRIVAEQGLSKDVYEVIQSCLDA